MSGVCLREAEVFESPLWLAWQLSPLPEIYGNLAVAR
jgi:hypothetical protein